MNCLAQCLPVDCTQGVSFIIIVGLMVHHQGSALMVIGHLLGAKETGRENQFFLSTYSVPGLCLFSLFSFSSVQSLTRVWFFATPWTAACQASLSITDSRSLLRLPSIELVMPCNHLILCRPLLLSPSIFPQHQGLFRWVSSSHQVAKVLVFQRQHQSFQWIFRTGWISLLSKGLSRVFSNTTVQKHQFFLLSFLYYLFTYLA